MGSGWNFSDWQRTQVTDARGQAAENCHGKFSSFSPPKVKDDGLEGRGAVLSGCSYISHSGPTPCNVRCSGLNSLIFGVRKNPVHRFSRSGACVETEKIFVRS